MYQKLNRLKSLLKICCKSFLHLDDQSKQGVFLFSRESLGELEKAVETLACSLCSTAFLILPNFYLRLAITQQKYATCFLFLNCLLQSIEMKLVVFRIVLSLPV